MFAASNNLVSGILEEVIIRTPRPGFTVYDLQVDGVRYGHGPVKVTGVAQGDRIQFEQEMRGSFRNVKIGTLKKYEFKGGESDGETSTKRPLERAQSDQKGGAGTTLGTPPNRAPSFDRDDYWRNKDKRDIEKEVKWDKREEEKQQRITFETCRKQAMDYVSLLAQAEALWLKKTDKVADRQEYIRTLVDDLTRKYFAQSNNRANFIGGKSVFDEDLSIEPAPAATPEDGEWA
jgi:hypothetical protein